MTSKGSTTYTKIGDSFLNNQISIENIQRDQSVKPMVYNIRIQNHERYDMNLKVMMDFYDTNGVKLDNPWGWKPVTIAQEQDEWIKFTAPSDLAVNFKFYVKKAEE